MKISLIVPIYNCERSLRNNINNFSNQTYEQIEIILVDDGSTDSSPEICDMFAEKDNRIKVIHKKNEGVSSARNRGLAECTGDYFLFIDPDDSLDLDACERIATYLDGNVKLLIWDAKTNQSGIQHSLPELKEWESLAELAADIIGGRKNQSILFRACWAKVFKRSCFQGITFPEELYIGEDACYLLRCLPRIEQISKVQLVHDSWYTYFVNPLSATKKYKADLLEQSLQQLSIIQSEIKSMNIENERCIRTALTEFSWQGYFDLKRNSMIHSDQKSSDCSLWREQVDCYLSEKNIDYKRLPRFKFLCWFLSKILPDKIVNSIVEVYVKNSLKEG